MQLPARLQQLLDGARAADGRIVALTAAGISAESGIPTFRGPEGYWRVGSSQYRPEDLATYAAFRRMPAEIWGWYLYRRGICLAAEPNAAHRAMVALEHRLGERFSLITQNVDGLHLRAGSSRPLQVHGNLHFARCAAGCSPPRPLPAELGVDWPKDRVPEAAAVLQALHCEHCGSWLRPHVLWFDECYDEEHYRFDTAMQSLDGAALLLVVGASGATTLPNMLVQSAFSRQIPLVVVNLEPGPFSQLAQRSPVGFFAEGRAGAWVPAIAARLGAAI